MSTGGGRFTLPVGMQVESASYGYFDKGNQWVGQGNVSLGQTELFDTASDKNPSVFVEAGTTVLLKCKGTLFPKPYQIVQAEFVSLSSDAVAEYDIQNIGFAGNGYVKLPSHEGAYITWEQLDGKEGGERYRPHPLFFGGQPAGQPYSDCEREILSDKTGTYRRRH